MYQLEAVIGRDLAAHADRLGGRVVRAPQGFDLLPMVSPVWDRMHDEAGPGDPLPGADDFRVPTTSEVAWIMAHLGQDAPRAYVVAEYFGGSGEQFTTAWSGANVFVPPMATTTAGSWPLACPPMRDQAINVGLRAIGVVQGDAFDEFDALDLGRFRRTREWVAAE